MSDMITVTLPAQPYSYLDRKLGRPDALKNSEAFVGRDAKGKLTIFQNQPGHSNGGFWGCSGYYQELPQTQAEMFKHLKKAELIKVKVTW